VYLSSIHNLVELPIPIISTLSTVKMTELISAKTAYSGTITPPVLNQYYNIFTNSGNSLVSQTVYSTSQQYFSPSDIAAFQSNYHIPPHPVDFDPNSRNSSAQCIANYMACIESNLDLEYIMAIAQQTPTSIM